VLVVEVAEQVGFLLQLLPPLVAQHTQLLSVLAVLQQVALAQTQY
jgi:hypothetical protein